MKQQVNLARHLKAFRDAEKQADELFSKENPDYGWAETLQNAMESRDAIALSLAREISKAVRKGKNPVFSETEVE